MLRSPEASGRSGVTPSEDSASGVGPGIGKRTLVEQAPVAVRDGALVVDEAPTRPEQIQKSQLLAQLHAHLTETAQAELGPVFGPIGRPYIDQYVQRWSTQPASAFQAHVHDYAPTTRTAQTGAELIAPMVARMRADVHAWAATGRPPGTLLGLTGGSLPAIAQPQAGEAGGSARASLGTMQAGLALDRCASPPPSRPGELWPGGPITKAKSVVHTLADYVDWVHTAEAGFGNSESAISALRRLYYSKFVGAAAAFDDVILSGNNSDPPMAAPAVPATVIDRLYETSAITTPSGTVDISHVFAELDLKLSGETIQAQAAELREGLNFAGTVSWLGDLASWFQAWDLDRRDAETQGTPWAQQDYLRHLYERANVKVDTNDLLGDIDAQVITAESTHPVIVPGSTSLLISADMPPSQMLKQYYGMAPQTDGRGTASNRFQRFVENAQPQIPHTGTAPHVALAANAQTFFADEIAKQAKFFDNHGGWGVIQGSPDPDVATYRAMIDDIAHRFTVFLTTGLATGNAPWPGPP
jgi:hypothetical protein